MYMQNKLDRSKIETYSASSVKEGSSRGSAVTVMALRPANLGSAVAGSRLSHWWWQKVHPAKISPMCQ